MTSMYSKFIKECTSGRVIENKFFFYTIQIHNRTLFIKNMFIKPKYRNSLVGLKLQKSIWKTAKNLNLKFIAGEINIENPYYEKLIKFVKAIKAELVSDDFKSIFCIEVLDGR